MPKRSAYAVGVQVEQLPAENSYAYSVSIQLPHPFLCRGLRSNLAGMRRAMASDRKRYQIAKHFVRINHNKFSNSFTPGCRRAVPRLEEKFTRTFACEKTNAVPEQRNFQFEKRRN